MTDSINPQCAAASQAIHALLAKREQLMIVPQNLYEFWAVATRKPGPPSAGQNGLGMTPEQASQWLQFFQRRFTLLPDREELLTLWHDLVKSLGILGARSTTLGLSQPCRAMGSRGSLAGVQE